MTMTKDIQRLRELALKKIQEAAEGKDSRFISYYTRILEEADDLIEKSEDIRKAIDELGKRVASPPNFEELLSHRAWKSDPIHLWSSYSRARPSFLRRDPSPSPRMTGELCRQDFVQDLKNRGIELTHESGSLYRTQEDGLVGIAYASERQRNRWLLGLPPKDYFCIVLLCESRKGEILNFIIPENFYRKYEGEFSESSGQLKFNVNLKWDRYQMTIPNVGPTSIDEFLNNYSVLQAQESSD